jgi:hypothetical protein
VVERVETPQPKKNENETKSQTQRKITTPPATLMAALKPVSKKEWVPDSKAPVCQQCKVTKFGFSQRRHHCRGKKERERKERRVYH